MCKPGEKIAVDGTQVPLELTMNEEGQSVMKRSMLLGILIIPLFFLMKGKQVEIPAGTTRSTYTAADVEISAY